MTSPMWRLYLNLDDGAEVWVGGRRRPLHAGRLYGIPAWLSWRARCHGRVRHFNAMVDLPSLPRERVMAACDDVVELATPTNPLALMWQACAVAQSATTQVGAGLIAQGHAVVWAALARLFELLGTRADGLVSAARDQRFDALHHWVEQRLDQPLPRAALARAAGCSEAELARRFASGLGTSPARWLRDRRVARAAELLRATDLTIEVVAQRCGLGDRSRMSKTFARLVGSGPAAYRQRLRSAG